MPNQAPFLGRTMQILMADDDEDDRLLALDALGESGVNAQLHFVGDGVELFEFLEEASAGAGQSETDARGSAGAPARPCPDLILLDLNMPRRDGREALQMLKNNAQFRRIPVVIFTTSRVPRDIVGAYDDGANSFLTKPMSFEGLVEAMKNLGLYWSETVRLPSEDG